MSRERDRFRDTTERQPRRTVSSSCRQWAYSFVYRGAPMLYAILCYDSESVVNSWSKAKDAEVMTQLTGVMGKLAEQKRLGPVARLMPTTAATTVRKGTEPLVLDGPFAETKEQLLGFYVVECGSLEAALETAQQLARASGSQGAFEVRPLRYFNPGGDVGSSAA